MDKLDLQLRSAAIVEGKLTGVVHAYGTRALVGNRYEEFASGAFDQVLSQPTTDVAAFWNHNRDMLLGRQSAGTVEVDTSDPEAIKFGIDLPDTSYANDIRVLAERGDIGGMSFGFVPGKVERFTAPDGREGRRHLQVSDLVEISPVSLPAFAGTSVALRSQPDGESIGSQIVRAKARAHKEIHSK